MTSLLDQIKKTLEESTEKFKFVFIHNLVGGANKSCRGGAEAAKFYEWGGYTPEGDLDFEKMRPGWESSIHKLLVDNKVSAVFHGHDHFYAKQELDGIIYQLVPQPGTPGRSFQNAEEYSYIEGKFLPSTGHLRVAASDDLVTIEYIKSSLENDINGTIADKYELSPK